MWALSTAVVTYMYHVAQPTSVMMKEVHCFSAVNMTVILLVAVVYLSVILLSQQADAQPTADETMSCSSPVLQEVTMEIKNDIKDVKILLASNQIAFDSAQPSKQALVSALRCEYCVSFAFSLTVS